MRPGFPVAGANIVVKGTTNGTVSDMDGNFSLEAAPGEMLEISYIGFLPMEVKVDNKNKFDILMKEDAQGLDEVVVVGYGTVKKRDLTGSVASVNASKIALSRPPPRRKRCKDVFRVWSFLTPTGHRVRLRA